MKNAARMIWLHLVYYFRCWQHGHAIGFRSGLEVTIANERVRAQGAVEDAEVEKARAYAAIVAERSANRIPEHAATESQ